MVPQLVSVRGLATNSTPDSHEPPIRTTSASGTATHKLGFAGSVSQSPILHLTGLERHAVFYLRNKTVIDGKEASLASTSASSLTHVLPLPFCERACYYRRMNSEQHIDRANESLLTRRGSLPKNSLVAMGRLSHFYSIWLDLYSNRIQFVIIP